MKKKKKTDRTQLAIIILGIIFVILLFTFGYFLYKDVKKDSSASSDGKSERYISDQEAENASNPVSKETDEKINSIIEGMTLEEKVAQLFIATPEALTDSYYVVEADDTTKDCLAKYPIAGILYKSSNITDEDQIKKMITNSQAYSEQPLFIAIEEENGSIISGIADSSEFDSSLFTTMAEIGSSGDTSKAYTVGSSIGTYLSSLGFNLDLAPVADVLTNSENTTIGDRSFGNDTSTVSSMVSQAVSGFEIKGVSATLKYFPGSGSASIDPNTGLQTVTESKEEIEQNDLPAFTAGIDAGADFVMVGHFTVSALTGDDTTPASLSSAVVTDLLRGTMGYDDIVITDSIQSSAVTYNFTETEAIVKAIQAGCDIILDPSSVSAASDAVLAAVKDGKITEDRIDESLYRIFKIKLEKLKSVSHGTNVGKVSDDSDTDGNTSTDDTYTDDTYTDDTYTDDTYTDDTYTDWSDPGDTTDYYGTDTGQYDMTTDTQTGTGQAY